MGEFSVQRGALLFAQILEMYGELNAVVWRVSPAKGVKQLRKDLAVKLYEVEQHLLEMGIDLTNKEKRNLQQIYTNILIRLVPWKKSRISYHPASLRKQLSDYSEEQMASYQGAYQLLWLTIWQRLRAIIKADTGHDVVSRLFAKNTLVNESQLKGERDADKKDAGSASALAKRFKALKRCPRTT